MATFDLMTGTEAQKMQASSGSYQIPDDVKLSERLLEEYDSAGRKAWAKNALDDDAFRNNVQWDPDAARELEKRNQMPIAVNVVYPSVEQAKALLTTNKPRFASTGREDSDTRTARVFSDMLTWVWDVSSGNTELKICVDDYYVRGMGVLYAYHDPGADFGNGEVCIKAIDPFDVYWDPNAKDIYCRDAAHVLVVRVMTGEQIQRQYPELNERLKYARKVQSDRHPVLERAGLEGQAIGQRMGFDGHHAHYEVIDRYSRIKKTIYKAIDSTTNREVILESEGALQTYVARPAVVQTSGGREQVVTQEGEVRELQQLAEQTGGVFHYAQEPATGQPTLIPGPEGDDPAAIAGSETRLEVISIRDLVTAGIIEIAPIVMDRILRVMSVGGVRLYAGELPLEDYPILPLMNRHNRNPYPMSDVRFVRPIQEYINKIRSLIMAHAANSTNVKAFIPRGSVNKQELEREWAKAGAGLMEYDAEFGIPIIAAPPPLPNELYKNEADARKDVQEILGIYPLMQGDQSAAPATYKGTVALDEYGQRRIKSKKDDIEGFLNQLAKVVVQFIQNVYTRPKVMRLLEPNHPAKKVEINTLVYNELTGEILEKINDVTVGRYDVVVVSGSTLPSNRWARFEYYMELFRDGIIDQVEVLKQTEVADMEGVLDRFSEIQKLNQMVMQLQEQLKNTQGDLQTASRESVQDRKRVEVEKFKSHLKGLSSKAEGATELYKNRLGDQAKIQKLEARAAKPKGNQ